MKRKPVNAIAKTILVPVLAFLFAALMVSCDHNRIYEEFKPIENARWDYHDSIFFQFEVDDSLNYHNFLINLRHNNDYPYANIHLFVTSYLPDGRYAMDTLSYVLAQPDGKWLGSGIGDIKTIQLPFQNHVIFPRNGTYTFSITHGMRDTLLNGITETGFRIEKAEVK